MKAIETLRGCWGLVGIADGKASAFRIADGVEGAPSLAFCIVIDSSRILTQCNGWPSKPLTHKGPLQCIGLREGPLALLAMQRPKENL